MIFDHLENTSNLKFEEISQKPNVFSIELEKLLGSGARVVEVTILNKIQSHGIEVKKICG